MNKKPITIFYLLIFLSIVPVVFGWWVGNQNNLLGLGNSLITIGRLMGLLSAFSILLELVLISRLPFIEKNFDLHDIIELHRLNGYMVLITFVSHIVFVTVGYATPFKTAPINQFVQLNQQSIEILLATIGSIIFAATILTSVKIIRSKINYQVWYIAHLLMYIAIALTFLHQITKGRDFIEQPIFKLYWILLYTIVFGFLIIYRFARPFFNYKKHRFYVDRIQQEAQDIYSVYIKGKSINNFGYLAGQYATFWFLSKDTWREGHAYSFSSEPEKDYLRVTVKVTGDFGKKIPKLKKGIPVIIDGPRGSFTAKRSKSSNVILIAGGIGVAPYLSTIRSLLNHGKNVTLYYAVHNKDQIAFKGELNDLFNDGLKIKIFNSTEQNKINDHVLQNCVHEDTDVYICGPDDMTKQFKSFFKDCGMKKEKIIAEQFSF